MYDSLTVLGRNAGPEPDTFRTANFMIELYGEQASAHAASSADQMLTAGDAAGYDAWLEVGATIQRLEHASCNENAASDAALHPSLLSRLANRFFGTGHTARLRHPLIH